MKIAEISRILEDFAPLNYQESYDNCGLLIGSPDTDVQKVLISLDVTDEVMEEAIRLNCNLIVAHHPLIFSGLKRLSGNSYTERLVVKAIKNDLAIYAIHTNLDNIHQGVNQKLCSVLGIQNPRILSQKRGSLQKLFTYVPPDSFENLRTALWEAGAGHIGNYSETSFRTSGIGSFKGNEQSNPVIGAAGRLEELEEYKLEVIFPESKQKSVLSALFKAHPYEEVAYEIIRLENSHQEVGSGMIGELETPMSEADFLLFIKKQLGSKGIRHSALSGKQIKSVAVCGGSGSFLTSQAIGKQADAFVTADFKYHQFFDADQQILLVDAGHYETEQFTKELIQGILSEKIPILATLLSSCNTNPVKYL